MNKTITVPQIHNLNGSLTVELPKGAHNLNDRDMSVIRVPDGLWIYIDGYKSNLVTDEANPLEKSIIFVDTMYDKVKVHVWSHPDVEDPTHIIELKGV